jgi:lipoate-protein ligase A
MDKIGRSGPGGASEWRLLETGPQDGALNMAIDVAIAEAHARGWAPPTVRIYRWSRPTLSLGRFQDPGEGIDFDLCAELEIAVVRRPTGGRAILHTDDVTYSFIARQELLRCGTSVGASYKEISLGIRGGLGRLGICAVLGQRPKERDTRRSAECFASTSLADLCVAGTKVAGCAQCRHGGVILQQGTIPLGPKPEALMKVFTPAKNGFPAACGGLSAAAGREIGADRMIAALADGFEEAMNGRLGRGGLLDEEWRTAEKTAADFEVAGYESGSCRRPAGAQSVRFEAARGPLTPA